MNLSSYELEEAKKNLTIILNIEKNVLWTVRTGHQHYTKLEKARNIVTVILNIDKLYIFQKLII